MQRETLMNKPITVLIADDHPVFRRGLVDALKSDPEVKVVQEAGDGEAALELIQQGKARVALLDVRMPKANGLDIARAVQARNLAVLVVMLTMADDEATFSEAMDLGVKGYVTKESAVTDILNCVKTVASGKHFVSSSLAGYLIQRRAGVLALQDQKSGLSNLTPMERRVLQLVAADHTTKEIAALLGTSPRTVESHRFNLSQKLELRGTHSLLKFAFENRARI